MKFSQILKEILIPFHSKKIYRIGSLRFKWIPFISFRIENIPVRTDGNKFN
jgi:hypothetical protein